jgi:hypothetical protein
MDSFHHFLPPNGNLLFIEANRWALPPKDKARRIKTAALNVLCETPLYFGGERLVWQHGNYLSG